MLQLYRKFTKQCEVIRKIKISRAAPEIADLRMCRMRHMVAYMRRNAPDMHVVIVGILPRGAWTLDSKLMWPNRMTAAVNAVNTASEVLIHSCKLPQSVMLSGPAPILLGLSRLESPAASAHICISADYKNLCC